MRNKKVTYRINHQNDLVGKKLKSVLENFMLAEEWWDSTNKDILGTIEDALSLLQTITNGNLSFLEWLLCCPIGFVRKIAEKILKKNHFHELVDSYKHNFQRWRVKLLLSEAREYSVEEVQKITGLDIDKLKEIVLEIKKERAGQVKMVDNNGNSIIN